MSEVSLVMVCGWQKTLRMSAKYIVCTSAAENSCCGKFGLPDGLWFKLVNRSEQRNTLSETASITSWTKWHQHVTVKNIRN